MPPLQTDAALQRSLRGPAHAAVRARTTGRGARWSLVLAALLAPALARGDARAPRTNGIHFQPGDDRSIYLATTFGLLISRDDGCSFRWVCESNIGYAGTFDPKYRIARDGTIFATTYSGLRVSRDGGCSFTTATAAAPAGDPGRIAGVWIDAIDIAPTGDVWVATADGTRPNDVFHSTDNGATFAPAGLASRAVWWKSVTVAPSRAQRVYVTGYQVAGARAGGGQSPPATHLEVTDDTGAAWREVPLTGVRFAAMPLVNVLAVDPANPDAVLLASVGANAGTGDRLYRALHAGAAGDADIGWTEVLATSSPIVDAAFLASGTVLVATAGARSFRSIDRGATFAPLDGAPLDASPLDGAPQLACVGQRGDGAVFGCGANWDPDNAALARMTDAAIWSRQLRFHELAGVLDCPAGTAEHDRCAGKWPAAQQQFGATGPAKTCPAPPIAPTAAPAPHKTAAAATGGCCGAGTGSPGAALGLALLCAALLAKPRARPPRVRRFGANLRRARNAAPVR